MSTRDDHVITISYPDGTTIVEHADGTRITTYYRENQVSISSDDNQETGGFIAGIYIFVCLIVCLASMFHAVTPFPWIVLEDK